MQNFDTFGDEISANQSMLLIGEQEASRKKMRELGAIRSESSNEFTYGNYYRFFPEMSKQKDQDWQSETRTPRAAGFGRGK